MCCGSFGTQWTRNSFAAALPGSLAHRLRDASQPSVWWPHNVEPQERQHNLRSSVCVHMQHQSTSFNISWRLIFSHHNFLLTLLWQYYIGSETPDNQTIRLLANQTKWHLGKLAPVPCRPSLRRGISPLAKNKGMVCARLTQLPSQASNTPSTCGYI